ncbi:hypothetical protein [Paeniglutamicibacter antarcticus]|uniref:Uncharacterized protein n=1 Tax=Paeniglutamicibacter antarcticus TaxID=494023 RepID=A0ABP9TJD1_9MICC
MRRGPRSPDSSARLTGTGMTHGSTFSAHRGRKRASTSRSARRSPSLGGPARANAKAVRTEAGEAPVQGAGFTPGARPRFGQSAQVRSIVAFREFLEEALPTGDLERATTPWGTLLPAGCVSGTDRLIAKYDQAGHRRWHYR